MSIVTTAPKKRIDVDALPATRGRIVSRSRCGRKAMIVANGCTYHAVRSGEAWVWGQNHDAPTRRFKV